MVTFVKDGEVGRTEVRRRKTRSGTGSDSDDKLVVPPDAGGGAMRVRVYLVCMCSQDAKCSSLLGYLSDPAPSLKD